MELTGALVKIIGLFLTLIFIVPRAAASQDPVSAAPALINLAGVVRDINGQPLAGAEVIAGQDLRAVTSANGEFTISGIPRGTVDLLIRRIGYQPAVFGLATEPDVKGVTIAATLSPAVVELRTVVVEGKKLDLDLWQNGFYTRERRGSGVFFSPERLQRSGASVSTLMQEVPSVQVRGRPGAMIPVARTADGAGFCPMDIFLDGTHVRWATEVGIDNLIARENVRAIEVYNRPGMMPAAFTGPGRGQASSAYAMSERGPVGGSFKECGAILIWSKSTPREE
jgi:hypothetical protein